MTKSNLLGSQELNAVNPEPQNVEVGNSSVEPAKGTANAIPKGGTNEGKDAVNAANEQLGSGRDSLGSTAAVNVKGSSMSTDSADSVPKPPQRPKLERQESSFTLNLKEFKAAFPDKDDDLCRALLVAASNNLESAFTGMLALSDPTLRPNSYVKEQIVSDEQLARSLVLSEQNTYKKSQRLAPPRRSRMQDRNERRSSESSDNLYEGFQRGLSDTTQVVSSFWDNLKSRFSGELSEDDDDYQPRTSRAWNRYSSNQSPTESADASAPRLPPRKPSRASVDVNPSGSLQSKTGVGNTVEDPKLAGALGRTTGRSDGVKSVNVFGDETGKDDVNEPDAFYIGESDDDLGSLNELTLANEAKKSEGLINNSKALESKEVASNSSTAGSAGPKDDKKDPSADTGSKARPSSAQKLLNKVRSDNDK